MEQYIGNQGAAAFDQDFVNKYHPVTSGSALNISQFAQEIYTGINEIALILKSDKIEKNIIEELSKKLNEMRDDIIPKVVRIGADVNNIENNQKKDRKLAIIAIAVAITVPILIEVVRCLFQNN